MSRTKKTKVTEQEKIEKTREEELVVTIDSRDKEQKEEIISFTPGPRQCISARLERLIKEETKMVTGRFRNYESPGGCVKIIVRKYPNIPVFDKMMVDNETYTIPLYVARHLNGVDKSTGGCDHKIHTCSWPTHAFMWADGSPCPRSQEGPGGVPVPIVGVSKWNRRFGFESMEFDINNDNTD